MSHYDLIVLGTGGVGSAALYHASRRGLSCLGVDRFPPAHDRGSSHGESRLIRLSYFEHASYVPLLKRSYELWDELDPGLLHRSGLLYFGPASGEIVDGVLSSARLHALDVDVVEPDTVAHFGVPPNYMVLHEADAGWLPVERCVLAHLDQAVAAGASHRWDLSVTGWSVNEQGVTVNTDKGCFSAGALVITGGPWSGQLLPALELPLTVQRKHLHWFRCDDARYSTGFFFDLPNGQFYGFPVQGGRLKLAEHTGGEAINDPLTAHRAPDPVDDQRIEAFVCEHLPGVSPERLDHKTCFYTRTPDQHFFVDRYPGCSNVAFAAGLSGHGFKFASALGELLVDLATGDGPRVDCDFLSLSRMTA